MIEQISKKSFRRWSSAAPKTTNLPDAEIATLTLMVSIDRAVSASTIGRLLGEPNLSETEAQNLGRLRLRPLVKVSALRKTHSGLYEATEKGRIAAALLIAKDAALFHAFFDI